MRRLEESKQNSIGTGLSFPGPSLPPLVLQPYSSTSVFWNITLKEVRKCTSANRGEQLKHRCWQPRSCTANYGSAWRVGVDWSVAISGSLLSRPLILISESISFLFCWIPRRKMYLKPLAFFFSSLLKYNWHIIQYKLKVYTCWFDTFIYIAKWLPLNQWLINTNFSNLRISSILLETRIVLLLWGLEPPFLYVFSHSTLNNRYFIKEYCGDSRNTGHMTEHMPVNTQDRGRGNNN